jgi:carboxymethylenebutenolidase
MSNSRTESIPAADGGTFDGYLALPDSGSGPGLVLLQEIFGVNDYIKQRAGTLADLGYTVLAPDLYWRIEPGIALTQDQEGLEQAFTYMQRLDRPKAALDAGASLRHLRHLPETESRAGVFGFCLGGRIGFQVAADFDPDVAVLYYGSGTAAALDLAPEVVCPTLFHFGDEDSYISAEDVEKIRAAFKDRNDVEIHVHKGAGHAFDNYLAPMFHRPQAREEAWPQTQDFLNRHFPVTTPAGAGGPA